MSWEQVGRRAMGLGVGVGVGWLCGAVGAVTACDEHDLYTTRIQKRRSFT